MLASGRGGSILNIGSLASISALGRGHVAYSMAMGAVVQLTRELSTESARRGVRVDAILPHGHESQPRQTDRGRSGVKRSLHQRHPPRTDGCPRRYSGTRRSARIRCLQLDPRSIDSHGWRKSRRQCRRNDRVVRSSLFKYLSCFSHTGIFSNKNECNACSRNAFTGDDARTLSDDADHPSHRRRARPLSSARIDSAEPAIPMSEKRPSQAEYYSQHDPRRFSLQYPGFGDTDMPWRKECPAN